MNQNTEADLGETLGELDNGIKFEEEETYTRQSYQGSVTPKAIKWTIKYSGGLVKNEKQANYVLLTFVVLAIAVSLFLLFGSSNGKAEFKAPVGNKVIYSPNAPPRLQYPVLK